MSAKPVGSGLGQVVSTQVQVPQVSLGDLPTELILLILENGSYKEALSLSLTCRRFHSIAIDNLLWREYTRQDFPYQIRGFMPDVWIQQYRHIKTVQSNLRNGVSTKRTIQGAHPQRITQVKGKMNGLCTGSSDGLIKVWRREISGMPVELQSIPDSGDGILALSPDQKKLVCGSDTQVQILSRESIVEPFVLLQTLPGDGSKVKQVQIESDHVFSLAESNVLSLWKQDVEGVFHPSTTIQNVSLFCLGGTFLFIRFTNDTTKVWKKDEAGVFAETSTVVETTPSIEQQVTSLAYDGDLFMADSIGAIKVFRKNESDQFQESQSLNSGDYFDPATTMAFYNDCIFVGSLRGTVNMFVKRPDGQFHLVPPVENQNHTDQVNSIAYRDGYLITGSTDATAKIWERNPDGTFRLARTEPEENAITCVGVERSQFVVGCSNGLIKVIDFTSQ